MKSPGTRPGSGWAYGVCADSGARWGREPESFSTVPGKVVVALATKQANDGEIAQFGTTAAAARQISPSLATVTALPPPAPKWPKKQSGGRNCGADIQSVPLMLERAAQPCAVIHTSTIGELAVSQRNRLDRFRRIPAGRGSRPQGGSIDLLSSVRLAPILNAREPKAASPIRPAGSAKTVTSAIRQTRALILCALICDVLRRGLL